ncbi:MAG: response regulator receiver sensor hybrid histidine kinase [Myxococcales bacterium]|nr:response regulator receiver sensor hybrid histidine kinase [Myxococcales bacterium]
MRARPVPQGRPIRNTATTPNNWFPAIMTTIANVVSDLAHDLAEDDGQELAAPGKKLLVVDDIEANRIALEAALAPLEREIVTANSGFDALAKMLEDNFALVLLDVQMPGMDGYETARWIRSRPRSRHVPIIFATAFNHDDEAVLRAYQLGAVDFLFKPVHPDVLRAKAQVFMALQERTAALAEAQRRDHERVLADQRQRFEAEALRRQVELERTARGELGKLHEQLALADRRKTEFLAILGHELRNPLAPIRTSIDLVREFPDRPIPSRHLDIIDRQLDQLTRLVDDLLDVSRITAGKIELRTESLDLASVIEFAVSASKPSIDARRHTLTITRPEARAVVVGDSARLVQVVSNLLNNAARYTETGGRIELEWGAEASTAYIRITDNGVGIASSMIDKVFEMFVQERVDSDGSGGLGLGLALSKRIIELHGGSVSVKSEGKGRGSTFEIQLPATEATMPAGPTRAHHRSQGARAMRAIVIDDNADIRDLIAQLLSLHGHEVLTASDGQTGLDMICKHQPDVALVDLGLPGLDGFEIAHRLRELCPGLQTRLVAMTGYGQEQDRRRAIDAGFHVHVVKPASSEQILSSLYG